MRSISALALFLLAIMLDSSLAIVKFGLLVCEDGPVIYRQTTSTSITYRIDPPSRSECTAGQVVCNANLGFFPEHNGLNMCSVSRNCVGTQQICLKKFQDGSNPVVEECCKPGFEAWFLGGSQET